MSELDSGREPVVRRSVLVATVLIILLMLSATLGLGYVLYHLIAYLIGSPPSIDLPVWARALGVAFVAAGAGALAGTMRCRPPRDILVSTSDTLMKLVRNKPVSERKVRSEPFVPRGPYLYVRNPMYFGVVMLVFGSGLGLSSPLLLLWGLTMTCWFWFFLISFEERELYALFGEPYAEYRRQVPKLFPYGRRYRQRP